MFQIKIYFNDKEVLDRGMTMRAAWINITNRIIHEYLISGGGNKIEALNSEDWSVITFNFQTPELAKQARTIFNRFIGGHHGNEIRRYLKKISLED